MLSSHLIGRSFFATAFSAIALASWSFAHAQGSFLNDAPVEEWENWLEQQTEASTLDRERIKADVQGTLSQRMFKDDPRKAAIRDGVLDFLGIVPKDGHLIIFVSTSMGPEMIQAYLKEAVWSGAALMVRGIPDGMTLGQWVKGHATNFVKDKGPTASYSIDPGLFDQYGIDTVPTIVWDESGRGLTEACDTVERTKKSGEDSTQVVATCDELPEGLYYKISGAITVDYALEQFSEAGAKKAGQRLDVLRKYVNNRGQKEQEPFKGDWASWSDTPEHRRDLERAENTRKRYLESFQQYLEPFFDGQDASAVVSDSAREPE